MTEDQREKWLEAFARVYRFVPLSQYDETVKLAEYAFAEMMGEVERLRRIEEAAQPFLAMGSVFVDSQAVSRFDLHVSNLRCALDLKETPPKASDTQKVILGVWVNGRWTE